MHNITSSRKFFVFFQVTNKKPITVLDILEKIRLHVSVPQCDVFGYLSIESEIVILIIPVDQNPKPLQVGYILILFTQYGFSFSLFFFFLMYTLYYFQYSSFKVVHFLVCWMHGDFSNYLNPNSIIDGEMCLEIPAVLVRGFWVWVVKGARWMMELHIFFVLKWICAEPPTFYG